MAGQLTLSTLNDSSGVLATQNGMSGIAKAWVNFNGTNGSIRGSFNASSITTVRAGVYYVNFTTNMTNTNYSAVATSSTVNNNNANNPVYSRDLNRVGVAHYESNAEVNSPDMYVVVFSS